MEIVIPFLLFSSFSLIFFSIPTQSANSCKPESCGGTLGPEVRFPFRLTGNPVRCGYPGFELSCNSKKETILKLPVSGEFRVNSIDYSSQIISMNYTGSCLPSQILNFNLLGSPFRGAHVRNYAFLNCSGWEEVITYAGVFGYRPIPCLSGSNFTVLATNLLSPEDHVPPICRRIENVLVPAKLGGEMGSLEEIELLWSNPACSYCEKQGRLCGFKDDSSLGIDCYQRARSSGECDDFIIYPIFTGNYVKFNNMFIRLI